MDSCNCCREETHENKLILSQLSLIKLLSDKNRLQILCLLRTESHTVSDLVEHLVASQSLVSHHLVSLKKLSLVVAVKSGRQVVYSLSQKGEEVIKLLKVLSSTEQT